MGEERGLRVKERAGKMKKKIAREDEEEEKHPHRMAVMDIITHIT